jgi:hypothetical protein
MVREGWAEAPRPIRYATVRAISQVTLRLEREQGDIFAQVRREVLDWINRKAGRALPKEAWGDARSSLMKLARSLSQRRP